MRTMKSKAKRSKEPGNQPTYYRDRVIIHRKYAKRFFILSVLFIFSFCLANAQNPGDNVFSGIKVYTIKITMTQKNYWDSLVYYYNQGLEHYMSANLNIDGTTLSNIGIRLKGNASYSHPNNKKPFRLSFDEFNED